MMVVGGEKSENNCTENSVEYISCGLKPGQDLLITK